jgi:hypothetical protein
MRGGEGPVNDLPELPLEAWREAKTTLHLFLQIAGKVRMALHPKWNHWWHVTLYPHVRGLTTRTIPHVEGMVELEFDLLEHAVRLRSGDGRMESFALRRGLSVAEFHRSLRSRLDALALWPQILSKPYDPARVGSAIPFEHDSQHADYDPAWAHRYWKVLSWTTTVSTEFSGRFRGKSSPVHVFWHSMDLAHTRFSGRLAPPREGGAVDREAYSHEVISFGFWPGDDDVPAPSYYSYTAPLPEGLAEEPLEPPGAEWTEGGMALLPYDVVRRSADPRETLLSFLESAYRAGAARAAWDVDALDAPREPAAVASAP